MPDDLVRWRPAATPSPRVLFVDHASRLSGAELVLLDVIVSHAGRGTVFLFEDGPLQQHLSARGMAMLRSAWAGDLGRIRRDRSLLRGLPALGRMAGVVGEIAAAARRHDLIYANSQKAFVLAAPAALLARRRLVWHLHDILDRAHFGRAQIALAAGLANRVAARVVAPSRAVAEAFTAAGGDRRLLAVIPNGIEPPAPAASRTALRSALGLPEGFLFGVFSRLAPWKGQHVALAAVAGLPDAHCILVGDALFGEASYAAILRRDAERLGVAGRVHFLGHRGDVARLMAASDAVLHPSVASEPFGRTLVEAMLAGVPVIASDAGAAREILDDGALGLLVPPGDAAAVVAALADVRARGPSLRPMLEAARQHALSQFGAGRMRARIDALVAEAAGAEPAG